MLWVISWMNWLLHEIISLSHWSHVNSWLINLSCHRLLKKRAWNFETLYLLLVVENHPLRSYTINIQWSTKIYSCYWKVRFTSKELMEKTSIFITLFSFFFFFWQEVSLLLGIEELVTNIRNGIVCTKINYS
jgi:hypothetical protein